MKLVKNVHMVEREYATTTEPDGTVVWAIWRKI